jgi:PleD family two-component response regulator
VPTKEMSQYGGRQSRSTAVHATRKAKASGHTGTPAAWSGEQLNPDLELTATVLVVDDEECVRESTAAILRAEGFEVLEAAG